ncbi:Arginase/deacetylase [Eremomyces bilateralis CBS 781.70]|uniref:agmatinase n=1 Tax=Eremomyces bilateralis CBS 781.70 TaxID=1392243 RepID=A0A6G1GG48_9PEZI|nr:Arginase/deacetylase [Eremomyces bilateralis CBS 781.70]KAF1816994.1 Arginase/deacetylase [Eremomyces bilateralis CBS 781.70]
MRSLRFLDVFSFSLLFGAVLSHQHGEPGEQPSVEQLHELEAKWGNDWAFSGISTFAHLPHVRCLTTPSEPYDIAIIGVPFDTAVSYRPGARFGPRAIRAASARQTPFRGFNTRANLNPFASWANILDCGDIPVTPFDNALALRQMTEAYVELGLHPVTPKNQGSSTAYYQKPKLISLGGDHSIALAALRGLKAIYGAPVAVVHFDAHLDTWHPAKYPSAWLDPEGPDQQSFFTHGSMFWTARNEGLIANGSSVHAGLRTRLSGIDDEDYQDDAEQGWERISTDDIDEIGVKGVVKTIMDRVGTEMPVYLSVDIDVIDPGLAPGTGTPEPGGWSTRELIQILRGIEGLNVVGADIVEVSPAYDGSTEATALAGAQVAYEILTSIVKRGLIEGGKTKQAGGTASRDEL